MRRRAFVLAAGGAAAGLLLRTTPAQATPAEMEQAIRQVVGIAPVGRGRVRLDVPALVENGNGVPLGVSVESPMTATDHVRAIHVFAGKNPLPQVVTFRLGPRAGRASVATRVRLADTQTLVAIAEFSDGTFWSDRVDVVVTIAACLEEL